MSIKEGSKRARAKSRKTGRAPGHVVPEDAIREFVESIGVRDIGAVAARLQAVADLTEVAVDSGIDELDKSVLRLIKEIARESNDKHYRRMMRSIIDRVGKGRDGIDAAHAIAGRAVQLAFRWTPDYYAALDLYREKLRLMR
ncbi:MAG: hypothetical protein AABO41_01675 [Acidobacteriota bacterium]